jgi:hypothetical protein
MNAALLALLKKHNLTAPLRREIAVVPRIVNEAEGLVDYTASDETMDSYCEIIRVAGWRFNYFERNAPFVNSHMYGDIRHLLGCVVSWKIENGQLVERVKYSRDPGTLADWAFKMVRDSFLKAVSVGLVPISMCSKWDGDTKDFLAQITELKLDTQKAALLRAVYREQEQIELSQCILGANPNALARALRGDVSLTPEIEAEPVMRAFKAGCLTNEDAEKFSTLMFNCKTARPANSPAAVGRAARRGRLAIALKAQLGN